MNDLPNIIISALIGAILAEAALIAFFIQHPPTP